MAAWSAVKYSTALKEQRFDAEFWQPAHLAFEKVAAKWPLLGAHLARTQYGLSREMNDHAGVPIFRMDEMDDIFLTVPEKFADVTPRERDALRLSKNDVLFNRTNSTRFVGRTGILKEDAEAIFASYLVRLTPDQVRLFPDYLAVYLNSPTGTRLVKRRAKESINQTNVSPSELRKVRIPLPTRKFQDDIAEIVNEAAAYRRRIGELYLEAESELLGRLGDMGLAMTRRDSWYVQRRAKIGATGRIDAEFYQPKYLRLRSRLRSAGALAISECCDAPVRGVQPEYVPDGLVLVVTSKHLGTQHIDMDHLDHTSTAFYEDADNAKARLRFEDVLIYATGAYVGRTNCWFSKATAMASNHVTIVRPDRSKCCPGYLALFLNSVAGINQSEQAASGSTQRELYPSEISKILVYAPTNKSGKIDLPWQQRLADKVYEANEAKLEMRQRLRHAQSLVEQECQRQKGT